MERIFKMKILFNYKMLLTEFDFDGSGTGALALCFASAYWMIPSKKVMGALEKFSSQQQCLWIVLPT